MTIWQRIIDLFTRQPERPRVREFVMSSDAVHQEIGYLGIRLLYPVLLDEKQLSTIVTGAAG